MAKEKSVVEQYADEVLKKKGLIGNTTKLAIKRHKNDLKKQNTKEFPYYFDESKGEDVIKFIELLTHSKGKWKGKQLLLEPWQKWFITTLYGWRREDGTRRFRKAYIQTARKNGKTIIGAALELYDLLTEAGAEVYSIATKQEQASISFKEAKNMVKASAGLSKLFTVYQASISYNTSALKAMSSQDKRSDGFNPSFVLVDEYHEHPTDELIGVYSSGMVSREEPLLFVVTTAGTNRNKPCYLEYERCKNILSGILIDDATFCLIYELDEGDDWHDKKCWIKSNPNLGVSLQVDALEVEYIEATQKPSKENTFKTKNLNIWTNTLTAWIKPDVWKKIQVGFDVEELKGRVCFGGLDLSQIRDLSALTWCFPPVEEGEKYKLIHRFYIPEETIVEKLITDNVSIQQWIKEGFITATTGATIDYDYIYKQIAEDSVDYKIKELAYDRYKANDLVKRLDEELGLDLVEFNQSLRGMAEATKEFERYIYEQYLQCFNPVMAWNMSCAEIKIDVNGNYKPLKPDYNKSGKRIDGVITSIMALNRTLHSVKIEVIENPFTLWAKDTEETPTDGKENPFNTWV